MVRYQSMKNQGDINYVAKSILGFKILPELPSEYRNQELWNVTIIHNKKDFVRNG